MDYQLSRMLLGASKIKRSASVHCRATVFCKGLSSHSNACIEGWTVAHHSAIIQWNSPLLPSAAWSFAPLVSSDGKDHPIRTVRPVFATNALASSKLMDDGKALCSSQN